MIAAAQGRAAGRAPLALALAAAGLTAAGCQSNVDRSARLARQVHAVAPQHGLQITRVSGDVTVVSAGVVHDANGTAAVITVTNRSSRPLADVPVAITLRDSRGRTVYENNAPGLEASLTSVPLLLAHQQFTWVDDQVQATGTPASASAVVGAADSAPARSPAVVLSGIRHITDPSAGPGAEGTVVNRSGVAQQGLVVFGVARLGGRVVGAGRAVVPQLAPHASAPFQLFFIGNPPTGASLQLSAPPTTLA